MDDSVTFTPRPSAIPRLSKLPLPHSTFSMSTRAPSPIKQNIFRPTLPASQLSASGTNSSFLSQSVRKPPTIPQSAPRPGLRHSTTQPPTSATQTPRPPLGQAKSLQSKPSPVIQSKDTFDTIKGAPENIQDISQQENSAYTPDYSDVSPEEDYGFSSKRTIRSPHKNRLSLSERTVESLALVPPSPASTRKGSNLFTPQRSTTLRPPSLLAASTTIRPKLDQAVRATSPLKRSVLPTPQKQTTLPRVATLKSKPALPREPSPTKTTTRASSAASNFRSSTNYGTRNKTIGSRPTTISRPSLENVFQTPQARRLAVKAAGARLDVDTNTACAKPNQSSSTILREKIAQARAAQREIASKPDSAISLSSGSDDFEAYVGSASDEVQQKRLLCTRVDAARQDGRLNIAGLRLKHIPDEVLTMYDSKAMEKSSISWYEAVDLTRFIAADNEIEGIGDGVFPDASKEALALEEDSQGNQFGGLNVLDLHGNLLTQVPRGLRRLEQLTVLNLSRNKLDNSAFDIVTQIPSLRELRLADNDLSREIPESIGSLTNLEILDVHGNRLSHLPMSVRELVHLRHLDVSKNRFTALPMDILAGLPLSELFASNNALFAALFSAGVTAFSKLQVLEVANNALAALSFESTLQLPALQRLDVSNNRLNALPDISMWSALSVLLVEDNGIQCLPEGFTNLMSLRSASFRRNNIRTIDPNVASMAGLEVISLEGNPLIERKYLAMSVEEMKWDLQRKLEVEEEMF